MSYWIQGSQSGGKENYASNLLGFDVAKFCRLCWRFGLTFCFRQRRYVRHSIIQSFKPPTWSKPFLRPLCLLGTSLNRKTHSVPEAPSKCREEAHFSLLFDSCTCLGRYVLNLKMEAENPPETLANVYRITHSRILLLFTANLMKKIVWNLTLKVETFSFPSSFIEHIFPPRFIYNEIRVRDLCASDVGSRRGLFIRKNERKALGRPVGLKNLFLCVPEQ